MTNGKNNVYVIRMAEEVAGRINGDGAKIGLRYVGRCLENAYYVMHGSRFFDFLNHLASLKDVEEALAVSVENLAATGIERLVPATLMPEVERCAATLQRKPSVRMRTRKPDHRY